MKFVGLDVFEELYPGGFLLMAVGERSWYILI